MIRRALLALAACVLLAGEAHANTVILAEGFESQTASIACPATFLDAGTSSKLVASNPTPPTGAIALVLGKPSATRGACGILPSGQGLTGTIWFYGRLRVTSGFACQGTVSGAVVDMGTVTLQESCTNSTNNHTWAVKVSSTTVGSTFAPAEDTVYPVAIKIVTGSGSATAQWWLSTDGQTWTAQGSALTGQTITNVDAVSLLGPTTLSGGTFVSMAFDDILVMTGTTQPDANTVVGTRSGSTSTPQYNGWTDRTAFVGGSTTNIANVWTSPVSGREDGALNVTYDSSSPFACQGGSNNAASCTVASQCPGGTCAYGYADSPAGSDTGQTMKFAAWDSGGPPTIAAATVSNLWGCTWAAYVTKHNVGGSTSRTYVLRHRYASADTDSSGLSLTTDTYSLFRTSLDTTTGADAAAKITNLNGLEVGGIKSASATGLSMEIQDVWLQCAWSITPASSAVMWVQDEE